MAQWYNSSFDDSFRERRQRRLDKMRKRMIENALREEKETKTPSPKINKVGLTNG